MIVLLLAHLVAALLAPLLVARLGRSAFLLLALVPAAAAVWALAQLGTIQAGGSVDEVHAWVPTLGAELAFRLDGLALVMVTVVGGVGALVLAYCARYFGDGSPGLGRFAAVLTGFAGAMLGLVVADDLIQLYVFWELTTVLSFLLIGHDSDREGARRAAMDALVVTTLGGLAMLVGAIVLGQAAGSYRISDVVAWASANGAASSAATLGVLLLVVGAVSKSALFPFHFWLPGAMAAPTPVSAYLHAAAMVKAGPYLILRVAPGFEAVPAWREVVVVLGVVTMLAGAWRALRQFDLKLLLAHGTVSQLGLLMVLAGAGTRDAALAGVAMLVAHALYKSTLFLVVGIVDRGTGTRDLRALCGLGAADRRLAVVGGLAALSMAGVPPLAGFAAKESVYEAFETGRTADALVLGALVLGSLLTVAYAARFLVGAFGRKSDVEARELQPQPWSLLAAPAVLAAAGVAGGLLIGRADGLVARYADTVAPATAAAAAKPIHLAAWHGLGLPLLFTAVALVGGVLLFRRTPELRVLQGWFALPTDARRVYLRLLLVLERSALRVTAITQTGSLPVYLTAILVVVLAGAGAALATGGPWDVDVRAWDTPAQAATVALVVVAAAFSLRARRRLKAVMVVSVVGYGVAVLFALQGAPDLALTQFLAETVTLVVLLLVLRRLPSHFSGRITLVGRRRANIAIGLLVGIAMAATTVVSMGAREAPSVSADLPAAAERAGGYNVVNVTLVDVRAWDTMGEIGVLVVAATGITSLVFLRRRSSALPRREDAESGTNVWGAPPSASGAAASAAGGSTELLHADARSSPARGGELLRIARTEPADAASGERARGWLRAEETLAPERRSLMLEVVVRLIFHTILVLSVYLLLAGHDVPGGGFAGGIVAGLALVVRYLAGGRYELGETLPVGAGLLIGLGLVIVTGYGVLGGILGSAPLQSVVWETTLPVWGDAKVVASTVFDVGVYLVVVGVVLDVLRSFGSEIDRQEDERRGAVPGDPGPDTATAADAREQERRRAAEERGDGVDGPPRADELARRADAPARGGSTGARPARGGAA